MNELQSETLAISCPLDTQVEVSNADRWKVYYRLQELHVACQCRSYQPLWVKLHNAKDAIHLWSVVKQNTASRQELIQWLEQCWQCA